MNRTLAGAIIAAGLLASTAGIASATPTPEGCTKDQGTVSCTTTDDPSNGWVTDTDKKGSVNSSHPEVGTVTNPGGNQPPSKQP